MRHSQPAPRASNARRAELKQDWQGGTPDPGWDTTRKRHVPEYTVPRCLPTLVRLFTLPVDWLRQ